MKFEAVSYEECKRLRRRKKKVMQAIDDFWKSDMQAATVDFNENEYKSIASAQSSFSKAAKKMKVGVIVMSRDGKLYLVKEKI